MATVSQQTQDALIAEWIEPNPNKPGRDEYRLKRHYQSVWAIIGYWQGVQENIDRVAHDYRIPREAVEAAIAYYHQHKAIIDNRIDANDPEEPWKQADVPVPTTAGDALITEWIEPNPGKPGWDEYRLKQHYQSVWAIVGYWQAVGGDIDRVAHDYRIPREAVEASIAYYQRHRAIIDNRLDANER